MSSLSPNGDQHDSTATSLIVRISNADPDAWEKLTTLYGPVVYGWARQAGLQPYDASDVMQNVFHAVAKHIGRFRKELEGDSFRAWLWTISRNKIHDHFRSLKTSAKPVGGTDAYQRLQQLTEEPPSRESRSGLLELSGLRQRALELVQGSFEHRTWRAFWRTAVEGDSPADVAADLDISVWAVYKARSRVLQRLREEFEGLIG